MNTRSEAHAEEAATEVLRPPDNLIVCQPLVGNERSRPPADTATTTGLLGPKPEGLVQSCTILVQRLGELEMLSIGVPFREMNPFGRIDVTLIFERKRLEWDLNHIWTEISHYSAGIL